MHLEMLLGLIYRLLYGRLKCSCKENWQLKTSTVLIMINQILFLISSQSGPFFQFLPKFSWLCDVVLNELTVRPWFVLNPPVSDPMVDPRPSDSEPDPDPASRSFWLGWEEPLPPKNGLPTFVKSSYTERHRQVSVKWTVLEFYSATMKFILRITLRNCCEWP